MTMRDDDGVLQVGYHVGPKGPPSDPVGINEIAQLLGAKVGTVRAWRTRGVLPDPKWVLSGTPLWESDAILAWARDTHRAPALTDPYESADV